MGHLDNSIKRCKYQHLNEKERYKIEAWVEKKVSVIEIANRLKKHKATIYRELERGKIARVDTYLNKYEAYRANVSQRRDEARVVNRERGLKIGKDREFEEYVRRKLLEEKRSPDVIIGQIKAKGIKFKGMVCVKTLYNYIDEGIFVGISNKDLLRKGKGKKQKYRRIRVAVNNRLGKSIEDRPKEIEERKEYGHWEWDCVVSGKGKGKGALLTLSERKSREEKIYKLKRATQEEVQKVMDKLEREYGEDFNEKFKSVTFDNGVEFLGWKSLEKSVLKAGEKRTQVYYAHPYSSWERGTNENQNGMIRRFIPKGSDISKVSEKEIKDIENWMNNYPRKILGYKTANEVVKELTGNKKGFCGNLSQ
jgi:IS30 family transposase